MRYRSRALQYTLGTILLAFLLLSFQSAFALETGLQFGSATGLSNADIRLVVARIIQVVLGLLGLIVLICILYGGFTWLTAAGNEENVQRAKGIIQRCLIGLVIILISYSLLLFVMSALGIGRAGLTGGSGGGDSCPGCNSPFPRGARFLVVDSRSPQRDATNVSRNSRVAVTFNEALDPLTVKLEHTEIANITPIPACFPDDASVHVNIVQANIDPTQPPTKIPIAGIVRVHANALSFASQANCGDDAEYQPCTFGDGGTCNPNYSNGGTCCGCLLSPEQFEQYKDTNGNVTVEVTLDSDIAGGGKILGEDEVWQFSVTNRLETTKPEVVAIIPPNDAQFAKKLPANVGVQVLFSKPIDPTTLIASGETDAAGDPLPATVEVVQLIDQPDGSVLEQAVPGTIDASVDSFIFRPTTACGGEGSDTSGCMCFAFDSHFRLRLHDTVEVVRDGLTVQEPGIRDNNCNTLDCAAGDVGCQSNFATSNVLDTTPPVVRTSSGDASSALFGAIPAGKPLVNPIDKTNEPRTIGADRTTDVFAALCDRYDDTGENGGCPGYMNFVSINEDTFLVSQARGKLQKILPAADTDLTCCFPGGAAFGASCPAQVRTLCPAITSNPPQASTTVRFDPDLLLVSMTTYYATLYGGGTAQGSCNPDSRQSWGIQDAQGNALVGIDERGRVLPNYDWQFTTGDVVNAGNPYIERVAPESGYREQCVSVLGANFGTTDVVIGGTPQSQVHIPYDNSSQIAQSLQRCNDALAAPGVTDAAGGCVGTVYFHKKQCADGACPFTDEYLKTGKLYSWNDNGVVVTVPPDVALDQVNGADARTAYEIYIELGLWKSPSP